MFRIVLIALALIALPLWGGVATAFATAPAVATADAHCPDHPPAPAKAHDHGSQACQIACAAVAAMVPPPGVATGLNVGIRAIEPLPASVSPDLLSWPPPRKPPRA